MALYDGNKFYHNIPGLFIPRLNIDHEHLISDINAFIEDIPILFEELEKNSFTINPDKRRTLIIKGINEIHIHLKNIYAGGLEAEALKIMRFLHNKYTSDQAVVMIRSFTDDVSALSVAIQKAQNHAFEDKEEEINEIETRTDLIKSLSEIVNHIDDSEFDEAMRFTMELVNHNPDEEELVILSNQLLSERYIDAKNTVNRLRTKKSAEIKKLAGIDFSKTILVVDDMPEVLSYVTNALRNNYRVIAVPSGESALKVLETTTPDLFIFDTEMPKMNGIKLAGIIRDNAVYANIPLILFTGNTSREHIATITALGCDDYIIKPSDPETILNIVGKYLKS